MVVRQWGMMLNLTIKKYCGRRWGRRACNWGRGFDRAPWLDPQPKRGSIDGTPKILPRLTPGPRR